MFNKSLMTHRRVSRGGGGKGPGTPPPLEIEKKKKKKKNRFQILGPPPPLTNSWTRACNIACLRFTSVVTLLGQRLRQRKT